MVLNAMFGVLAEPSASGLGVGWANYSGLKPRPSLILVAVVNIPKGALIQDCSYHNLP